MLGSAAPSAAAPPSSVLALPAAALRAQLRLLRYFWSTPKLRAPLLVVWVATLGGSLHAPAVPFFYVEMGLDAPAIGTLNSLSALGSLALAAPYGWLLDKRGPYTAILISSAMCGLGCLFRGLAPSYPYLVVAAIFLGLGGGNLVTLILAYVSTQTEPSQRALVVSGCAQLGARNSARNSFGARLPTAARPPPLCRYLGQLSVLNILGKALYAPADALLHHGVGIESTMLRYRIVMSICTFFCFYGVVQVTRRLRHRHFHPLLHHPLHHHRHSLTPLPMAWSSCAPTERT